MRRDPDSKRRLIEAARAKLGAGETDPAKMSDEQLLAAFVADPDAPPAPKPSGSPMQQWLRGLSDDELLAEYEAAHRHSLQDAKYQILGIHIQAEVAAQDAELARIEAAREARRPTPVPVPIAEPPVEPHPVALEEPKPPPDPTPKLTAREEWGRRQAAMMREAVDEAVRDGEAAARRDHARPATPYDGPTLGEMLRGE